MEEVKQEVDKDGKKYHGNQSYGVAEVYLHAF
jgi:hypothetical protein